LAKPVFIFSYRRSLAGTLLVAREATLGLMRPALRKAGLTEQQWRLLRVIEVEDGQCEPTRLAHLSLIQGPSMTRIMKDLVEQGLIDRIYDARNSRRSVLRLTDLGSEWLTRVTAEIDMSLSPHMESFGAERLAALMDELRALTATFAPAEASDAQG